MINIGGTIDNTLPHSTANALKSLFEVIHFSTGNVFVGLAEGGQPVLGTLTGIFGKYEGGFKNEMYHGEGKLNLSIGDVYQGSFQDGKFHGHGKYVWKNGSFYVGKWVNDRQEGYGENKHHSGHSYEGNWVNGHREGYGELINKNGGIYRGLFKNGMRNGYGERVYASGMIYKGEWVNDKMHGKGKLIIPDQLVCEGEFVEGKVQGLGICHYDNGNRFEGLYLYGYRHGYGVFYDRDRMVYQGEYFNDLCDGNGIQYYLDGSKYEGKFSNDKRNGKGVFTFSDGTTIRGTWQNDILEECKKTLKLSDSERLIAEIRNTELITLKAWGNTFIGTLNGEWKSDVYPLKLYDKKNMLSVYSQREFRQISITSSYNTLENIKNIASNVVKVREEEVILLYKTMQRGANILNSMEPGTIIRRHKEAQAPNPRTILGHKALDATLYAFVLCKKKLPHTINPGEVKKAEKSIGHGSSKVAKIAYEWFSGMPYINLSLNVNLSKNDIAKFEKELKFCHLFAGRRGFPKSAPIAVHYYTKEKTDSTIELKIGYFVPYYEGRSLHYYCNSKNKSWEIPNASAMRTCLMDIASALKTLEDEEVVHGDISSGNFLIDLDDKRRVKGIVLHDFGCSKVDDLFNEFKLGTRRYIPPEWIFWNHTKNKDVIKQYPHARDIWGAALCYLELKAKGMSEITNALEEFLEAQEEYCKDATKRDVTFAECCINISKRLVQFLELLKEKKIATEEILIIEGMLQVDPANRWTGAQVYEAVAKLKIK
jgi:hypothetical protein